MRKALSNNTNALVKFKSLSKFIPGVWIETPGKELNKFLICFSSIQTTGSEDCILSGKL